MTYIATKVDTCIKIVPRVGTKSIRESINASSHNIISVEEALNKQTIVMFVRHPINHINSAFNLFYDLTLANSQYQEFMPKGTITAWGARVKGGVGQNEHKWKSQIIDNYNSKLSSERQEKTISDDDLIKKLNNEDYQRFIDFILAGNYDDHWGCQITQSKHNGNLVPNVAHRFEEINKYWSNYFNTDLPHRNSKPVIDRDEYRLTELNKRYAESIAFWEAINGTWHAGN
jgi:hypothetical protein